MKLFPWTSNFIIFQRQGPKSKGEKEKRKQGAWNNEWICKGICTGPEITNPTSREYTIHDAMPAKLVSLPVLSQILKKIDHTTIIISCCSTEVFRAIAICPTCRSSALETGNGLYNNLLCTQTGRTSSYADTQPVWCCWTAPPTFPYSHLPF